MHKAIIDMDVVHDPQPSINLLNQTDQCVGYIYEGGIIKWDECNVLQKIIEIVRVFLHLWLPEILQKFAFYFGQSELDHLWEEQSCPKKSLESFQFE
jgi:hypothetical protein